MGEEGKIGVCYVGSFGSEGEEGFWEKMSEVV